MSDNKDILLRSYMRDVEKYPLITPEREKELSDIIHGNSTPEEKLKAKNELVVSNLRLVVKISLEMYNQLHGLSDINLSLMDIIQAGNIGLMRCADLFLSSKGFKFSTYMHTSIRRRIIQAIRESRFIRIPTKHFDYIYEIEKIEDVEGKDLEDNYLAKKLNIQKETIRLVKRNRYDKIPMEEMGENGNMTDWFDPKDTPIEDVMDKKYIREYIFSKMNELRPRYREVIHLMFFSNKIMTLAGVGRKLGISKEGIRLLVNLAIHSLKKKIQEDIVMKEFITKNKRKGKNEKENRNNEKK